MDRGALLGGRYRLGSRVGAGGMGEVWLATDEVLHRQVAVKVMLPAMLGDPGFSRRFLGEARAMASVRHPGVVAIHDFHSGADGAFLVMEYVEGESLAQVLHRVGRLSPDATMELVAQAADALQAAHDVGLVHRDVKPANLLLRPDGSLVLTDFGIARAAADTALTTPGAVLGTPTYLSPEQVLGQPATPRSDVYALGVVAYECLAGRRPFEGENAYAIALQRVHDQPATIVSDAPRSVLAVVEQALATDPAQRWVSAAELARAARAARSAASGRGRPLTGLTTVPPRPAPGVAPVRPVGSGRRRAPVVVGLVLAAVVLGVGGWIIANRGPAGADPGGDTAAGPSAGGSSPTGGSSPAGFVKCGDFFCPAQPSCWHGLNSIGGRAQPPTPQSCAEPHYQEAFLAAPLPADAVAVRQDELLDRPDIAQVCSEDRLADRSVDPDKTRGWIIDPWPVQLPDGGWIFYCMASSGEGELPGTVIRPGT